MKHLLNRIYNEDCLEGMKRIPDGFVALTVTSPPYDNLRTYNGNIEQYLEVAYNRILAAKRVKEEQTGI